MASSLTFRDSVGAQVRVTERAIDRNNARLSITGGVHGVCNDGVAYLDRDMVIDLVDALNTWLEEHP